MGCRFAFNTSVLNLGLAVFAVLAFTVWRKWRWVAVAVAEAEPQLLPAAGLIPLCPLLVGLCSSLGHPFASVAFCNHSSNLRVMEVEL